MWMLLCSFTKMPRYCDILCSSVSSGRARETPGHCPHMESRHNFIHFLPPCNLESICLKILQWFAFIHRVEDPPKKMYKTGLLTWSLPSPRLLSCPSYFLNFPFPENPSCFSLFPINAMPKMPSCLLFAWQTLTYLSRLRSNCHLFWDCFPDPPK